ncbi:MAG: NAD-dependent epimerase/dehydratase family protein [Dehalococcoidia bacterium]|nr:NAD-dependent epimerase/dehydratase family protein [Dehalococcoidia bacterium]
MRPRTVLVTGGAGFIGSHLVDRLLSLGHRVVVVDDLSTGRLHNLNKNATFYHSGVTYPGLKEIFEREQPDIVNHHAAQISVTQSVKDPIKDAEVNIQGTLRLIELARQNGVEKVIFPSSGGTVYGEPQYIPCDEKHPINPISPYALSKRVAEEYLQLYYHIYRLDYVTLRYGNVYGPRQDPHGEAGVIAIFTKAMLEGQRPVIYGTGEQERDFIYVDDVIDANILAMEEGHGEYNVGTSQGTSVNRVFETLKGIIKYKWGPVYGPARLGEIFKICLDSSSLGKQVEWTPHISLEEGLTRTVEYFRKAAQTPSHNEGVR